MPPRRAVTGRSQEPRQRFVEELRLLRAQKGDSLRQLGEVLGWDWSLFGKMERGETLGGPEVVQALDQHYGTPGLLLTLWELAAGTDAVQGAVPAVHDAGSGGGEPVALRGEHPAGAASDGRLRTDVARGGWPRARS